MGVGSYYSDQQRPELNPRPRGSIFLWSANPICPNKYVLYSVCESTGAQKRAWTEPTSPVRCSVEPSGRTKMAVNVLFDVTSLFLWGQEACVSLTLTWRLLRSYLRRDGEQPGGEDQCGSREPGSRVKRATGQHTVTLLRFAGVFPPGNAVQPTVSHCCVAPPLCLGHYGQRESCCDSSAVIFSLTLCSIFMKVLTAAIKAYRLENGYGSLVVKLQRSFMVETQMRCEVEAIKGGWGGRFRYRGEKKENFLNTD